MKSLEEALQHHSKKFITMVRRLDRYGALEQPDGYGSKKGICGDTVEFFLSVHDGIIQMATFELDGCFHTMACANAVTLIAEGSDVADSWEITPESIIDYLETLPEDHYHCAELVIGAFYLALANYHELQRQPWKKSYSRR